MVTIDIKIREGTTLLTITCNLQVLRILQKKKLVCGNFRSNRISLKLLTKSMFHFFLNVKI